LPYVTLNNKPIYLELTLDQAYHPEGFYTFPSDAFIRREILRTRQIGLNGHRIHVKIGIPRKLYWADKLGVLIMADVPNSWGAPDADMRYEMEYALRQMVKRDYNHPCIFSWVNFNETWGLRSGRAGYTPETQQWVESMYHLTKRLDPTRLVEDNSPCNHDHVATDMNTWHAYLPGYLWRKQLDQICRDVYLGSTWNFIGGRTQQNQPMFNSECGDVWGYEGSAGDVDWSWDYHIMLNEFRRHPKICGWLYTEHHDVINEWNGYWRYDRSKKFTGMDEIVPDMSLRDLHGPFYLASERELCRQVSPGQTISVPLYASFMTDADVGRQLVLKMRLTGWDTIGRERNHWHGRRRIAYRPWMSEEMKPAEVRMPERPGLAILQFSLETVSGTILHRNFTTYLVADQTSPRDETVKAGQREIRVIRFSPKDFAEAQWSLKQWNVLDGLKVDGAGSGHFEYRVPWPEGLRPGRIAQASFRFEGSAKQLFGKDQEGAGKQQGDFMRGKGTHDPSLNPNAYPMTDETRFPSAVRVRVNGTTVGSFELPDDSADHRGILSWFSQKRDRHLREAGSYGYIVSAEIPANVLREAFKQGQLVIRLEVDEALPHGLAIYGERFGRYPLDPSILFVQKN
ncbi:MAG: glycoside hydrolase family 2 TIM barrel-domain containing protein, partial [Sedimentisphaerales bacterium]